MEEKHEIDGFVYYSLKTTKGYRIKYDPGAAVFREESVLAEEEFHLIQNAPQLFSEIIISAEKRMKD